MPLRRQNELETKGNCLCINHIAWFDDNDSWTESIAVGSRAYVAAVAERECQRVRLTVDEAADGCWCLRDAGEAYGAFSGGIKCR